MQNADARFSLVFDDASLWRLEKHLLALIRCARNRFRARFSAPIRETVRATFRAAALSAVRPRDAALLPFSNDNLLATERLASSGIDGPGVVCSRELMEPGRDSSPISNDGRIPSDPAPESALSSCPCPPGVNFRC